MTAFITLTADDNHQLDANFCHAVGEVKGALIILHEIFGLTNFIKDICHYWSSQGYHAIAPALYDRLERKFVFTYNQNGYEKAISAKQKILSLKNHEGISGWDLQLYDINAAIKYLQLNFAYPINIIGFSWGGTLGWLAASRLKDINAVSAYYGTHIYQFINEKPKYPVILHCGEKDDLLTIKQVAEIQEKHPQVIIHTYPATHAFRCDAWVNSDKNVGQQYDAEASQLADERTAEFFEKSLYNKQ